MNMNANVQLVAAALALAVLTTPCAVRADTGHRFAFGAPANAAQVTKTIHVQATDQMRLVFDSEDIHRGDVVKFVVMNSGAAPHEFGIADEAGAAAHRQEMAAMPDMKHDDPNVISLAPGETKTLIWRFSGPRGEKLVFSCNVPGHYEAGMATRLTLK